MKSFRYLLLNHFFSGGCILCCLLFCLFLFSTIFIHQPALHHFSSGEVDSRTRIRVLPGSQIILQSHLLLLQYHHIFSLNFLNRDDILFPHRRVPQDYVTKMDIFGGSYHIIFFVFLTPLWIFLPRLEIIFFINQYFLVCIFKYRTSLHINSGLEI